MDELEIEIRAELEIVESSEQTVDVRLDELLFDRADAQRYEIGLRGLLGAVQAIEKDDDTP